MRAFLWPQLGHKLRIGTLGVSAGVMHLTLAAVTEQAWQCAPSFGDVAHQAGHFAQRFHIVVGVGVQDATRHVAVKLIEVIGQFAALVKIQSALQSHHDATGT